MDDTTICNLALGRICAERIMALDDSTQAARYCRLFYEQTRNALLEGFAWTFAAKRALLSRLAEDPLFGWHYAYQLPGDFLQIRQLNGWDSGEVGQYAIEGKKLLTDEEEAKILYTCSVTDPNAFSPLFVSALSLNLAVRLAQPLTGSRTMHESLMVELEREVLPEARRMDAAENRPRIIPPYVESQFVQARFGRGGV